MLTPNTEVWPAVEGLFATLSQLDPDDPARGRLRDRIIRLCLPAARREAGRYRRTGEAQEDLVQVASLALVLAVDRYDARHGIPFKHFAVPTILGEIKRHFRDKCWSVRVGRRTQELYQELTKAEPEVAQRLGRTPTIADLAEALDLTEDDVRAARAGEAASETGSPASCTSSWGPRTATSSASPIATPCAAPGRRCRNGCA
jgi:RNA polymerase sigma-B factor